MPSTVPTSDEFNALSARVTALEQAKPPNPNPSQPSPDGTTVTTVGPAIIDSKQRSFTLTTAVSAGMTPPGVAINSTYSANTQNVVKLYAKGGVCYQQNTAGNWWNMPDTAWVTANDPTGTTPPASGVYQIGPNGITDPSGKPYRANGINCLYRRVWGGYGIDIARFTSANLKRGFPKINFVRFADMYASNLADSSHPATDQNVRNWVTDLTNNGIIVYAEVHYTGNYATGGALNDACTWLTEWANTYKSNPLVWFGTQNEPHGDGAGISHMMRAMHDAVRKTGNQSPVLFACGNPGDEVTQMDPAMFADTSNTGFDQHYYGWMPSNGISWANCASQCAAFHNKQGAMTTLCLEFGDATDGNAIDGNWQTVCQQATQNGPGSAAWMANWTGGQGSGDCLLNAPYDFSTLTSYGTYIRDAMH